METGKELGEANLARRREMMEGAYPQATELIQAPLTDGWEPTPEEINGWLRTPTPTPPMLAQNEDLIGSSTPAPPPMLHTLKSEFIQKIEEMEARWAEEVEAMRSQLAQGQGLILGLVEAMPSQLTQVLKAFIPIMVEEVQKKFGPNPSLSLMIQHPESSASRILQLHFDCIFPRDGFFTSTTIQNHEGASVKVELRNSSGSIVKDDPGSSALIEISVLNGNFEYEGRDDWTAQDFENYAAKTKANGSPLKEDCKIRMSKGVAVVTDLIFSENSSGTANKKFRFRARVANTLPPGLYVRDAVSEPFRVKEARGKRPARSLEASPQCLMHIGPILCQKLAGAGIHTLHDFLQQYHSSAEKLQELLSLSKNKWSELVKDVVCSFTDTAITRTMASVNPAISRICQGQGVIHGFIPDQTDQGGQIVRTNSCWPSLPQYAPRYEDGHQLQSSSVLPEERGINFEASTGDNVASKLKAVCCVTKAAIVFMISIQQDSPPAKKKQRVH